MDTARGFTTGNADATLLAASVEFHSAWALGQATVTLREAQSNGKPATTVRATLSGTAGSGVRTFTCADGGANDCSLDAKTKYFIHVSGSSRNLVATDSNNETLLPADNGWSIEDAMRRQPNYDLNGSGHALQIEVEAQPHEDLSVSGITASGATLTIAGHDGVAWYYKHTNTGATCDGPVAAGTSTKVLTNLTAGTAYTFSAYSDSSCTTANLLARAARFTTLATLTASDVTGAGATLTIASHGGVEWYYKHTNTGATCDGPVAAGTSTKVLTGLTPVTSYTFSAYTDSACTTANLLATASQFTTPISLTVSNVGTTTARITIGGHSGQWWYQADAGPDATCKGPRRREHLLQGPHRPHRRQLLPLRRLQRDGLRRREQAGHGGGRHGRHRRQHDRDDQQRQLQHQWRSPGLHHGQRGRHAAQRVGGIQLRS